MKRIILVVTLGAFIASCGGGSDVSTDMVNNPNSASASNEDVELPKMEFSQELFEFGEITQGEKVNFNFTFTNTGEADLIISSAKGSCGCTVPQWPKEPIRPGETGEIKVVFNSDGKSGKQHKTVEIIANTQPSKNVVALSGMVIAPKQEAEEI